MTDDRRQDRRRTRPENPETPEPRDTANTSAKSPHSPSRPPTAPPLPFAVHRLAVTLRLRKPTTLHPYPAGALYALVCEAWGRRPGRTSALPEGAMVEVCERARVHVGKDESWTFGLTWILPPSTRIDPLLDELLAGLQSVGDKGRGALAGNFHVDECVDLVRGNVRRHDVPVLAVTPEHVAAEIETLRDHDGALTFVVGSPLRIRRSRARSVPHHAFLDENDFDVDLLRERIRARLTQLGVELEPEEHSSGWRLVDQRLDWLDLAWNAPGVGKRRRPKSLGGAVGALDIDVGTRPDLETIVLGQYVGIGRNTRFGLGRYRIGELGDDPFAPRRHASLVDLALADVTSIERDEANLATGTLSLTAEAIRDRRYKPDPHRSVTIPSGSGSRVLSIPSPRDRALQRRLNDVLAPALDRLFEESSFAYRKGLSTKSAARRVRAAFRDGYRWAWKLDFDRFFDTVPHDRLEQRLRAYLDCEPTVDLLMTWVREGGRRTVGLPTGAPISPVLANLFLDRFDEFVEQEGRVLVRYADDFLVLFRDPDDAKKVFETAESEAERLLMHLNDDARLVELGAEPFDYLGFRFEKRERWVRHAHGAPTAVEDLGWNKSRSAQAKSAMRLPGENRRQARAAIATVLTTDDTTELAVEGERLVRLRASGATTGSLELERVQDVVVLGRPLIRPAVFDAALEHGFPIFFARGARGMGMFHEMRGHLDPDVLERQSLVSRAADTRRDFAATVIAAKLRSYAALAEVTVGRKSRRGLPDFLRERAEAAEAAETVDEVIGHEGAGAAAWYRDFDSRLGGDFTFRRRIAPRATDPVNILLNLAQTALHREAIVALTRAGLAPEIGILHRPRTGHAALASDLQEPFRHLMDRVVLELTRSLRPTDFVTTDSGPYAMRITPHALETAYRRIYSVFARWCRAEGRSEALPYREQLAATARSMKRHVLDTRETLEVFGHPNSESEVNSNDETTTSNRDERSDGDKSS